MIHFQIKLKEFIVVRAVFELYNYYKKLVNSTTTNESMTIWNVIIRLTKNIF